MIPSPSLGPSLLANRASQNFFRPPFKRERLGEGAPSLGRSFLATRAEKNLTGPASAQRAEKFLTGPLSKAYAETGLHPDFFYC